LAHSSTEIALQDVMLLTHQSGGLGDSERVVGYPESERPGTSAPPPLHVERRLPAQTA